MIDLNQPELAFAIQAVRQAAAAVRQVQTELVSPALTKADRSPVTVADFTAQALVSAALQVYDPEAPLVGEESAAALRAPEAADTLAQVTYFVHQARPEADPDRVCAWIDRGSAGFGAEGRFWTLDPIDGTKGFLRGDQYAIALALIEAGQVQLGVLGCPNLTGSHIPDHHGAGSLSVAAHGQGAWTMPLFTTGDPERLYASTRNDPTQARLLRSFESGHTNISQIDEFAQALGVAADPVRMDSQAKYALLAAGAGELYLRLLSPSRPDYREKIWDQAAGSIVIEEAGGTVTDLHGANLDFTVGRTLAHNRGILASNGRLHTAALLALRSIGA